MDTMIMWGGYAAAVIVAGVAVVMLQKKGGSNTQDIERAEELVAKLSLLEKELSEVKDSLVGKEQELKVALQERDEKASALEALKNDFESQINDAGQSSIQKLSLLEKELSEVKDSLIGKEQELKAALQERDEKASALETLENDFENQMDDVVQSSIQKLNHAEQAKEDAVKAAGDNYEAAAEAYGQIKEKEKIIAELQKQLKG